MGHADNHFTQAILCRAFNRGFQSWNHRFAAFKAEAFDADEFCREELFKTFACRQSFQNFTLCGFVIARRDGAAFKLFLQPHFLCAVLHMGEFNADGAGINLTQTGHDFTQRGAFEPEDTVQKNRSIHIGVGKAVGRGFDFRASRFHGKTERIQIGDHMATPTIGAN